MDLADRGLLMEQLESLGVFLGVYGYKTAGEGGQSRWQGVDLYGHSIWSPLHEPGGVVHMCPVEVVVQIEISSLSSRSRRPITEIEIAPSNHRGWLMTSPSSTKTLILRKRTR